MKAKTAPPAFKLMDTDETVEAGHAAWKRDKIKRGLEQARDREALIPADQVWRNLGLER